jgi:hypothetical protein
VTNPGARTSSKNRGRTKVLEPHQKQGANQGARERQVIPAMIAKTTCLRENIVESVGFTYRLGIGLQNLGGHSVKVSNNFCIVVDPAHICCYNAL